MTDEEGTGTGEWDDDVVEAAATSDLRGSIRDLGGPEAEALHDMLQRYGDGILGALEARWVLKVIERTDIEPHRRVFALRRETLADLAPFDPVFLGIPLAHLSRKGARLTLEGGRLVAPLASRRTVTLGEKGTQLFLYGRHLFAQSIRSVAGRPDTNDEVLVLEELEGEAGRYIGIGIAERALRGLSRGTDSRRSEEIVVRNRLDLGLYLRAQQEIPQ